MPSCQPYGEASTPPMLRVSDLCAGYGGRTVLHGATFTLRAGECAALLGPNGSGKTTLIKLANGLLTPSEGEILVCNMAARSRASEWTQ